MNELRPFLMTSISPNGPSTRRRIRQSNASHVGMFMIGWFYYLAVPLAAGYFGLFRYVDQAAPFADRFDVRSDRWYALGAYVLLLPLFYAAGSWAARRLKVRLPGVAVSLLWPSRVLLPIYALLLTIFAYQARELLFGGYLEGYDASLMGPMATVEMVLLYQYIACKDAGLRRHSLLAGWLLLASSIVLLSMGGRIYVASAFAAVVFYRWRFVTLSVSARRFLMMWIVFAPLALAVIGMVRLGSFDIMTLGFFLFAEPLFTSISGISFMLDDRWNWLAFPGEFISSFVNVVPSSIWPNKVDHIVQLSDIYSSYESPFGAQSIIVSTIGNFGFVGGLMFVAAVGFFVGRKALMASTPHSRALYCFLISILPFLFFRDPYQIQVKLVITGLLLNVLQRARFSLPATRTLRVGVEEATSHGRL